MKFFLLLLLLGVVVVEVLRGRRGWEVAALLVVVLAVLRVAMMGGQLILFLEDLLRFRRCLKTMKKKTKKRLKRLVIGRISIDWSLREGAVDSFEKGRITIFSARLALVASFLLFDFLRRHHWICVWGHSMGGE